MARKRTEKRGAAPRAEQAFAQNEATTVPRASKTPSTRQPMATATATTGTAPSKLLNEAANVFTLLSDESRLGILALLLQNGELNVSEICRRLGQPQPAVSHHLALLRVSGAIEARRAGKNIFY